MDMKALAVASVGIEDICALEIKELIGSSSKLSKSCVEFDFKKSLKENIHQNIITKNKFLYQDVLFTLREELKEPRNYFSHEYSNFTKMG